MEKRLQALPCLRPAIKAAVSSGYSHLSEDTLRLLKHRRFSDIFGRVTSWGRVALVFAPSLISLSDSIRLYYLIWLCERYGTHWKDFLKISNEPNTELSGEYSSSFRKRRDWSLPPKHIMTSHQVCGKPTHHVGGKCWRGGGQNKVQNMNVCEKQHPSLWKSLGDRHTLDSLPPLFPPLFGA